MAATTSTPVGQSRRASAISGTLGLFAGMFTANGVPHTLFGLMGTEHESPFGTAARINLVWGLANLALGAALAAPRAARRARTPFAIGAVAGATGLATSLVILWS